MIEQQSKKFKNAQSVNIVTNYKDAVDWLKNDYILCNNITSVDESIWDNMRFSLYEEDEDGEETGDATEIFQYYLTSASEFDVKYLEDRFGLLFTYSDKLDCYVLCVSHFGTSWDYVYCEDKQKDEFWQKQIDAIK